MFIGKKKIKEISKQSFIHEVIEEILPPEESEFLNSVPETWQTHEKLIYDLLSELEHKYRVGTMEIINRKK